MGNLGIRGFPDPRWLLNGRLADSIGFPPDRPFTSTIEPFGAASAAIGGAAGISTANTKTPWVEAYANVPLNDGAVVVLYGTPAGGGLVDFSIGGIGGEQMIAENLSVCSHAGISGMCAEYFLPPIPSGSKLWQRHQVTTTTFDTINWVMGFMRGSWSGLLGCKYMQTLGADTSDSGGTNVEPGATPSTFGVWTNFGRTNRNIRLLQLAIEMQGDSARTSCNWWIDVAWAANGAPPNRAPGVDTTNPAPFEGQIARNMLMYAHATGDVLHPLRHGPFPCNVPAGAELFIRAACSTGVAADRTFGAVLYGMQP